MSDRSSASADLTVRSVVVAVVVTVLVVTAALYLGGLGPFATPDEGDYDRTTVTVLDGAGTELATVDVRVADTFQKRYVGLSDTNSLDSDEGMLFVHDSAGTRTYVMRDMDFPIDIVFIAANGTITTIHHAPVEPGASGDELTEYSGDGKYVLEVPYGYTNETGIEVGHTVRIEGQWGPES